MNKLIKEIEVIPIKAKNGLVAFASFVLYESLYCSSVGVFTKPLGGIRLVYPTKKVGLNQINVFHPINKQLGELIEKEVSKKIEEVMSNDRYNSHNSASKSF